MRSDVFVSSLADIVTSIPPKFGFLYKHASTEVIIDKFGNFMIDPSFVEKTMRGMRIFVFTWSVRNHPSPSILSIS